MSELINIPLGAEVKSVTLNSNFQYLDEKITSTNQRIETVSASIKSVQATLTSQLSSSILSNLQAVYPVGSLYIGVTDTCPIANLFGTWEKVAEGLCLQGVTGSQVPGETVEAGLPNITATFGALSSPQSAPSYSGAIEKGEATGTGISHNNSAHHRGLIYTFNASKSNPIYKDDSTVQPPAYLVNVWKRTV